MQGDKVKNSKTQKQTNKQKKKPKALKISLNQSHYFEAKKTLMLV